MGVRQAVWQRGNDIGDVVLDVLSPLISEARSKKTIERQSQYLHVHPVRPGLPRHLGSPVPAEFAAQKAKLLA